MFDVLLLLILYPNMSGLPKLITNQDEAIDYFAHEFTGHSKTKLVIALPGMGGDETSMEGIVSELLPDASLLGIRGNVKESGLNRFFKRSGMGNYDFESLEQEAGRLVKFIEAAQEIEAIRKFIS